MKRGLARLGLALALASGGAAEARRAVEIHFTPGRGDAQIAVWIEDAQGAFVDTAFLTRTTGQFGLGNRPGTPLLKTDFRWPYGRREMVLPIWAHRRDHHYPKVVMGGECGGATVNSPAARCGGNGTCDGDCVDSTIAYHSRVSSYEPFYCSPSGASRIDAMSCASKGSFSKGAFADAPAFSLYPPRADLAAGHPCTKDGDCGASVCQGGACAPAMSDAPETARFAALDDLVAISGATPAAQASFSTVWYPGDALADGDYVALVEISEESDFNSSHDHDPQHDTVGQWDFEGHRFLGQPSIVYRVPFHLGSDASAATTATYVGYGAWDGQDGDLRGPDGTITTGVDGSGAGRLLLDGQGARVTVLAASCPPDASAPAAVEKLEVVAHATSLDVSWLPPAQGTQPQRFDLRYHEGATPITDDGFARELAPPFAPPPPQAGGGRVTTTLVGLTPEKDYTVAVRGLTLCGAASPIATITGTTTAQTFTTLHGCFVATAAFGAPGDGSVATLRRLRDRRLLAEENAAGRLFVAVYYAAGPAFASAIARDERLRAGARALLAPLVAAAASLE